MLADFKIGLVGTKAEPTEAELQRSHRIQEAITQSLEMSFRRNVENTLNKYARSAAQAASNFGENFSLETALFGIHRELLKAFENQYRRTGEALSRQFFESLEKSIPTFYEHKDEQGIFESSLNQYIRANAAVKVTKVADTTRKIIRSAIEQAVARRLAGEDMARLIMLKASGIASKNRAITIARTETHSAAQFSQQAASDATGLKFRKYWVASDDERVREDHSAADTYSRLNVIGNTEAFNVGGESLMYPGDPKGSPEQIINCRCGVARRPIIPED